MRLKIDDQDLKEIRDVLMGNVDGEVTDEQIRRAATPEIIALAMQWGWSDTEVRDELCTAVEAARQ